MPNGEVAFVNGVNHKPRRAIKCAELISDLSGGYDIYTVYTPTEGLLEDLRQCYFELYKHRASTTVCKLHERWDTFFNSAPEHEKYLQFCHSRGAIQVRNALMRYSPEYRKRIVVVAIAPAAYIPDEICSSAYHYVSRRDIVPHFDREGLRTCRESVVLLSPHKEAALFDHHFLSPTYRPAITHHLQEYLKSSATALK